MQRRLSRKRPLFSIAVEIQELTLSFPSSASMSITAFDQLLFSITGKPALTSANKKREFLLDAHNLLTSSSNAAQQQTQEHTIRIAQRFPFQGTLRPRFHGPNGLKPQVLSMHLYGLKKSGWPKTLLATFTINVIEHIEALHERRESGDQELLMHERRHTPAKLVNVPANGGICTSSNLQLSLDGLLIHKTKSTIGQEGENSPPLTPSRLQWGRFSLPSSPFRTNPTPSLASAMETEQQSATPTRRLFHRNGLFPLERQIELVGWRRRRRTSRSQSTSPSHYGERLRRASSYEPRECNERMSDIDLSSDEDEEVEEVQDPDTIMNIPEYTAPEYTAGEQWRQHAEAEQANASLASELMTRRLSRTPADWAKVTVRTGVDAASHYIEFHNALHSHSDDTLSDEFKESQSRLYTQEDETTIALRHEVQTLRTEHADQRELIRRLLIENKRLMLEIQGCPSYHSIPLEPETLSQNQTLQEDKIGISHSPSLVPPRQRPTSSKLIPRHPPTARSRPSLTFTVVDGQEVCIDHHFDHIVQEMESDFEKLFGETPTSTTTFDPKGPHHRSIGKR